MLFIKKTRSPVIKKIKTKPLKDKVPNLKIRIFKKCIFFVNRFIMSLTLLVMVMGVLGFGAVVYKIHTLEPNARKIKLNFIKETLSSQTTITDTNDEILMQTELFNYYIPVDLKNKNTVSDLYLKTIIFIIHIFSENCSSCPQWHPKRFGIYLKIIDQSILESRFHA